MLRRINVNGHESIRMDHLRKSFEALGVSNVRTYVQSGNVVFEAGKDSAAGLAGEIQTKILHDFGFAVPVVVRTAKEMERVIRNNPFLNETGIDTSKLHVTFLSESAPKRAEKSLR
jgi:uncharacterized protein (DUF1697 family)